MAEPRLKSVTKRFGRVTAVHRVTLDIEDGEFIVLLGPSGSGKTTLLRLIAGLEQVDEGEIWIGRRMVNDLEPKDRGIAMVFQNYALYPHMTVYQNLAFPLENAKLPKDEIRRRIMRVSEMLRIQDLLDRKPKQLSGGQQQRVALGRALVREPEVFLMDEPLSNLDARLRTDMRAELKKMQKELGITTVYVTHDQVEAMTLADRIVVMKDGVVQQVGTPREIYDRPSNMFVADFIGTPPMNFFQAKLVSESETYLDIGGFKLRVAEDKASMLNESKSREFTVGIRPRELKVYRRPPQGTAALKAEVEVVEPLGDEMILDLRIGSNFARAVTPAEFEAGMGETVWVVMPPSRIHVFDEEGNSILRGIE